MIIKEKIENAKNLFLSYYLKEKKEKIEISSKVLEDNGLGGDDFWEIICPRLKTEGDLKGYSNLILPAANQPMEEGETSEYEKGFLRLLNPEEKERYEQRRNSEIFISVPFSEETQKRIGEYEKKYREQINAEKGFYAFIVNGGRLEKERLKADGNRAVINKKFPNEQYISQNFKIKVRDREIWINQYLISKPHAVGNNFEFFDYVRRQAPHSKIERSKLPDKNWGTLTIKAETKSKRFIKILNALGFKGETKKAFFYNVGRDSLFYRGDEVSKKDLEKVGVKILLFLKELDLAHTKNNPI